MAHTFKQPNNVRASQQQRRQESPFSPSRPWAAWQEENEMAGEGKRFEGLAPPSGCREKQLYGSFLEAVPRQERREQRRERREEGGEREKKMLG